MRAMPHILAASCLTFTLSSAAAPLAPAVASYRISCRYDAREHRIEGNEILTWTNTTHRPARELRFHLYLNAFRNDRSTLIRELGIGGRAPTVAPDGWGSISVSRMTDPSGADLLTDLSYAAPDDGNPDDRTVAVVPLPQPLDPGQSLRLSIDFVSRLPRVLERSGFRGDFVMAGQWFPKIGVFQDGGWNCHQYHATSEFFADFGDYDVTIDLPDRYKGRVGGTGRLVEERDAPGGRVIEHFRQDSVHDFAWSADPGFELVTDRFAEAGLPPVDISLLIQPAHRRQAGRYLSAVKAAMSSFGKSYGPYPYPTLTMIDPPWGARGAAGMEYPTLIVLGTSDFEPVASRRPEDVAIHEFGHQYFYGLLASNEFEEPWLDEGFTDYITDELMGRLWGDGHPRITIFGVPVAIDSVAMHRPLDTFLGYFDAAAKDPLTASWKFEGRSTYRLAYKKTALILNTLERLVGAKKMAEIMGAYARRYRFRHPTTADFISVVNEETGADWTPFFAKTIFSSETLDYAVAVARTERARPPAGWLDVQGRTSFAPEAPASARLGYDSEVVVERRGSLSLPVEIALKFDGKKTYRTTWNGAARWIRLRCENGPRLVEADVDPGEQLLLDTDRSNNGLTTRPDAAAANLWTARVYFWAENAMDLFMELW
jgi:hypothetical protein